jgi:hypothetical protein
MQIGSRWIVKSSVGPGMWNFCTLCKNFSNRIYKMIHSVNFVGCRVGAVEIWFWLGQVRIFQI